MTNTTAFILSSAIALALYELLAFTQWPPQGTEFLFYQGKLVLTEAAARVARKVLRVLIVMAVLLLVLTIHDFASPIDALAKYEANIVFGFVFGPLFAIWVNSVVVHSADKDLTRGQIIAVIALVLLFFLGAVGDETSALLGRYAHSLSSLKVGDTELSFTTKDQSSNRDRLAATPISGTRGTYVTGGSQGLQNLAYLDVIIRRDEDYLREIFSPKASTTSPEALTIPIDDVGEAKGFAGASITPAMSCLFAWFHQTGAPRPVDQHLMEFGNSLRELEALNAQINTPPVNTPQVNTPPRSSMSQAEQRARLQQISTGLVRSGLAMALDIALSATDKDLLKACATWFQSYCDRTPDDGLSLPKCLRDALERFDRSRTQKIRNRISLLTNDLQNFIQPQSSVDTRGLEMLPYFAIARASLTAQLGQHEAAAAILDDWLRRRAAENEQPKKKNELQQAPLLQAKDNWLALRAQVTLAGYIEEWMENEETPLATVIQSEHLKNLQATKDGLRNRLLKVDFFQELDKSCRTGCEPVFKRLGECRSDESHERLELWRLLYSSYITMEYTYIHRALEHPDYETKFAETVNDEARRLVNYDLSCGAQYPEPEAVYGQSLLGFVENAVSYSRLHAASEAADTRKKRLDEAERAARFALELIEPRATEDQERSGKRYLDRIAPSFAVQVQEELKKQLRAIDQARRDTE